MDDIDELLTTIVQKVTESKHSEEEKAEIFAQINIGFHRLVWPILLTHVPEYVLKEVTSKKQITIDDYIELISTALQNPATPKEIHDEIKGALVEVEALLV